MKNLIRNSSLEGELIRIIRNKFNLLRRDFSRSFSIIFPFLELAQIALKIAPVCIFFRNYLTGGPHCRLNIIRLLYYLFGLHLLSNLLSDFLHYLSPTCDLLTEYILIRGCRETYNASFDNWLFRIQTGPYWRFVWNQSRHWGIEKFGGLRCDIKLTIWGGQ